MSKIIKNKKNIQVLSIGFTNDIYEYKTNILSKMSITYIVDELKKNNITGVEILKLNKKNILDVLIELYNQKRKFNYVFINMILDYNNILYYSMFMDKLLEVNGYFIIKNAHFNEINKSIIHIEKTIKHFKIVMNLGNIIIFQYLV